MSDSVDRFALAIKTSAIAVPGVAENLVKSIRQDAFEEFNQTRWQMVVDENSARSRNSAVEKALAEYFVDPDPADAYDVLIKIAEILDEREDRRGKDE